VERTPHAKIVLQRQGRRCVLGVTVQCKHPLCGISFPYKQSPERGRPLGAEFGDSVGKTMLTLSLGQRGLVARPHPDRCDLDATTKPKTSADHVRNPRDCCLRGTASLLAAC
jgi:hypothetical protein